MIKTLEKTIMTAKKDFKINEKYPIFINKGDMFSVSQKDELYILVVSGENILILEKDLAKEYLEVF